MVGPQRESGAQEVRPKVTPEPLPAVLVGDNCFDLLLNLPCWLTYMPFLPHFVSVIEGFVSRENIYI